jgi:N-hydroxyarylamine O-acetyltransferase
VDVVAYLSRIGLSSRPELDAVGLEELQRAHLTSVPFENLHVYSRRGVGTGVDWSIPKIVDRGRGGWCFELNGAFAALLEALGFEVQRRAAVVLLDGGSGDPSHLTLQVQLDHPYLVDVGFGDSFIKPLRLDITGVQDGGSGEYVIREIRGAPTLNSVTNTGDLEPQYRLDGRVWSLGEFEPFSAKLQTEPGLAWTNSRFATRLLDGGPERVTLLHDRIKFRRDGKWEELPVPAGKWEEQLDRWFGLTP